MAITTMLPSDVPNPPDQSGESYIVLKVGQSVTITSAMLENALPAYIQDDNHPIGSIKILGFGKDPDNILRPTGTPIIAQIEINGVISRFNRLTGAWTVNEITQPSFYSGGLKITGNSIGVDFVNVVYTAYNTTNSKESGYSTDIGKLWIVVLDPNATNQPPSNVGNNTVPFSMGVPVTLRSSIFTTGTTPPYSDPDGDPAKALKILTLPTIGVLLYVGIPVTPNQIISMIDLDLGKLVYDDLGLATSNQGIPFTFQVCDTGTGIFVG